MEIPEMTQEMLNAKEPEETTYAVTIQVPRAKKLPDGRYYTKLTTKEQIAFIESCFDLWSFEESHYELTKCDPRIHLHAVITLFPDGVKRFLEWIKFKLTTPKYGLSYVLKMKPIYNQPGWNKYIRKDFDMWNIPKDEFPDESDH